MIDDIQKDLQKNAKGRQKESVIQGVALATSGVAGGVLGAMLGRASLITGLPLTFYGVFAGNKFMTSAGVGMIIANAGNGTSSATSGIEGIGEDVVSLGDAITTLDGAKIDEAKDRARLFLKSIGRKTYIPALGDMDGTELGNYLVLPEYQGVGNTNLTGLAMQVLNGHEFDDEEVYDLGETNPSEILAYIEDDEEEGEELLGLGAIDGDTAHKWLGGVEENLNDLSDVMEAEGQIGDYQEGDEEFEELQDTVDDILEGIEAIITGESLGSMDDIGAISEGLGAIAEMLGEAGIVYDEDEDEELDGADYDYDENDEELLGTEDFEDADYEEIL